MLNLLYVEDQEGECELLVRLLHLAGLARQIECEAKCARNLEEIGPLDDYDALLLDLNLGRGIAHTVGWIAAHFRQIPIVVVTQIHGHEAQCLLAGAEDYWIKPEVIGQTQLFIDAVNKAVIRHAVRFP